MTEKVRNTGTTKYRLGPHMYVRKDGTVHAPGSIIEFPNDERPSITWKKLKDQDRPADRTLAFHPNSGLTDEEIEASPANQPIPPTPPTAMAIGNFIASSAEEGDEPAISPEEQRLHSATKAEQKHKDNAAKEVALADRAAQHKADAEKAKSDREAHHEHKRTSDKNPIK